jgi:uncharacterized membrane protein YoaK (UPF0700 family)
MPRPVVVATTLLTFVTGVVDVSTFLDLGQVFASVMTGNLVLLGLAASTGNGVLARSVGTALVGYAVGVVLSGLVTRVTGERRGWPALVTTHLLALVAWAVLWSTARDAGIDGRTATLGVAALAMGVQSALVRLGGGTGLSTTYLTSTLTRLFWELVRHRSIEWGDPVRCLALVAGAVAGGALAHQQPAWVPAPAVAAAVLALGIWNGSHLTTTRNSACDKAPDR